MHCLPGQHGRCDRPMKVDTENELLDGWFSLVSIFEFVGCLVAEHPGVTPSRL